MPIGNFYNERKMIRHFISQGKRNAWRWILTLTVCLSVLAGASGGSAQEASPVFLQMIKSQHRRLVLPEKVRRLAVGDNAIVSAELLTERELLLFGLNTGRTTVLAWLESGKMRTYLCVVEPDLSILHAALHQVHPSIRVEVAPDRDAILLTGSVPDVGYSNAAEAITRDYFKAGGGQREGRAKPFVQASGKSSSSPAPENPGEESASGASAEQADGAKPSARVDAPAPPSASIINMIRLEKLPPTLEERIARAIREIGAEEVRVRRLPRGAAHNDEQDAFILEGAVPNQVALIRILNIAAHLLGGERARGGAQGRRRRGGGPGGGSGADERRGRLLWIDLRRRGWGWKPRQSGPKEPGAREDDRRGPGAAAVAASRQRPPPGPRRYQSL
ncbi:MAG: pilus assembly protein N-terminal domain-containing protein [Candidatus Manganitrophus sp.]|nr:MAG: pilus assembly protein N-terminal domain-containing protein [Candidatus Manganitrophus sp.]